MLLLPEYGRVFWSQMLLDSERAMSVLQPEQKEGVKEGKKLKVIK